MTKYVTLTHTAWVDYFDSKSMMTNIKETKQNHGMKNHENKIMYNIKLTILGKWDYFIFVKNFLGLMLPQCVMSDQYLLTYCTFVSCSDCIEGARKISFFFSIVAKLLGKYERLFMRWISASTTRI